MVIWYVRIPLPNQASAFIIYVGAKAFLRCALNTAGQEAFTYVTFQFLF